MWWCRTLVLAATLAAVAACGFQPLYRGGRSSEVVAELSQIQVAPIEDRVGHELRNHLLDALTPRGRPAAPAYRLDIDLSESKQSLAVKKTEIATRATLKLSATYQLVDLSSAQPLFGSSSAVTSGYDILQSEFATVAAERDARSRAVRAIAEEIESHLAVFFVKRRADRSAGAR
jgi:LPS-assembly lipoprotein